MRGIVIVVRYSGGQCSKVKGCEGPRGERARANDDAGIYLQRSKLLTRSKDSQSKYEPERASTRRDPFPSDLMFLGIGV